MANETTPALVEAKFKGMVLVDTPSSLAIFRAECLAGFKKSLETLRDMVKERTPVFRGNLAASISYELSEPLPSSLGQPSSPDEFLGRVFSSPKRRPGQFARVDYAEAVERGTRPHWPNMTAISAWVGAKLARGQLSYAYRAMPSSDVKGWVSFLVARKISKVGTPGHFMFKKAKEEFADQDIFKKDMEEAVETATKKAAAETPWQAI